MATRPSNRKRNEWAVSLVEPHSSTAVLEIGCGPGLALARLCETHPAPRVVGIDHSALMVATARRRIAGCIAAGSARVEQASADTLPFPEATFDRVLAVNSYAFWRTQPGAIARVFNVLRPGGRLVIVHQPRNRGATDDTTRAFVTQAVPQLAAAGFVDTAIAYLPLSPLVAGIIASRPLA